MIIRHKKTYIVIALICIIVAGAILSIPRQASSPQHKYTVVIDAGHGGRDGGSVGTTLGTIESEINLIYARLLKKRLESSDIHVVMTRDNSDGLYSMNATNYKKDDMRKRKNIIEQTNPDLVISIHMNSYPRASSKGAQVFYDKGNASGEYLARCLQSRLIELLPYARPAPTTGDYYILNSTVVPAVIVECGFLSNPQEEKLLNNSDYQELLTRAITYGVIDFLA